MSAAPRILAFAGSTRRDSFNKRLVAVAAGGAREAGAETTLIDLRDYPLPLFDEDLESDQGLPENAVKLKQLLVAHDGLLISSPEYNSSISAVLKNAIDWASRPGPSTDPTLAGLAGFEGKVAAIMGASPGGLGGVRGLVHLRSILGNIGVLVIPSQKTLSRASSAFGEDGSLVESRQQQSVEALGSEVARIASKLKD